MVLNNFARMRIFEELNCAMDIAAFNAACEKAGLEPMNPMEFLGKTTMYSYCKVNHPDSIESAMMTMARYGNTDKINDNIPPAADANSKRSCCGGGTVR